MSLESFREMLHICPSTPIDTEKPLLKDPNGEDVDVHTYRSMIGSLMYLTSSRPDIMFAVCACTHFQVTPKASHLYAVKRIFRYLKGKPHLGLWYPKDSPFDLVAYLDSDYAGASLDKKYTTRGCQFLGCRLISWQCKMQTVMATSSTEAKYVAAASGCTQVLWIQNQLLDYRVFNSPMLHLLRVEMVLNSPWIMPILGIQKLASPKANGSCDSPLLGVNIPRSDEDRLEILELTVFMLPKTATPSSTCTLEEGIAAEQVQDDADVAAAQEGVTAAKEEDVQEQSIPSPTPPLQPPQDLPSTSSRIDTSDDTIMEDVSNQGRTIDELDRDEGVALTAKKKEERKTEEAKNSAGDDQVKGRQAEIYQIDMDHPSKVLSMQEDAPAEVKEVVEVVTTAKLITKVVVAASKSVSAASTTIPAAEP
nr:uncharacterized mitochondrial protein AtMg00810-like [Tanacetum cinerariifolium]